MDGQDGKDSNVTEHNDSQKKSESKDKNYIILKAKTTLLQKVGKTNLEVAALIKRQNSYEEALKAAFDVFEVPKDEQRGVKLRCRPKSSPERTQWMYIHPELWKDIVEDLDMEFLLSGYKTNLRP